MTILLPGKTRWIVWPVPGTCDLKGKYSYGSSTRSNVRWGVSGMSLRGDVVTASKGKDNAL